jgi:hypothetical protein
MTAVTYGLAPRAAAKARTEKGFWARAFDRLVEARMRQVERELRTHLRYIPEATLKASGYRASLRDSKELPFVK